MNDEVVDVAGGWPDVPSHDHLHAKNQSLVATVRKLEDAPGVRDSLCATVHELGTKILSQVDVQITDELYEDRDQEETIRTLLPYHQRFFSLTALTTDHPFFEVLYYGSLEAMVGAFLWEQDRRNKYSHPMTMLNSVTYRLHLVLWRREEDLRLAAVEAERAQWRREHASVDEHKEDDADLSPAEKMRVFRNAVHARNKVGWIFFNQTHRTDQIQVSTLGLQRVQRLFELNPALTPADLLPIMDQCMERFCAWPAPPKQFQKGAEWHVRMGHRLHVFASYLRTIVQELGVASPVKVYLADEVPEEKLAA